MINLKEKWEEIRNQGWEKQEAFVNILISELQSARQLLQFFSEEKYVHHQGFKHIEGNVGEKCVEELSTLNKRIKEL